jgi:GNAT superfamily N-acetyltransferase
VTLAVDVLRRAGFGSQVGRLVEYPRRSPDGTILVAEGAGGVSGVACCASFGATGWIGALGVAPESRRTGLGTRLTEAAVRWLRGRGARTVLLYATDAGRPVYERLGFVGEQRAIAWRGVAGAGPPVDFRRLAPSDRPALRELDALATGEQRDAVLDAVEPLSGVTAIGPEGTVLGWAIASPWGAGTAITARTPEVGVALMGAASSGPAAGTLIVPEANAAAADALRAWRFVRLNDALRMRLGAPVAWRPELQFGLFNLFWG